MKNSKSGFTLVEIAFSLLVLGLGLLSIVNCFPAGLRASMEAHNDVVTAIFADNVFTTIRMGALEEMREAADWEDAGDIRDSFGDMLEGGGTGSFDAIVDDFPAEGEWSDLFEYPSGSGDDMLDKITYKLEVSLTATRLAEVTLTVKAGESGGRDRVFTTELYGTTPEYEEVEE